VADRDERLVWPKPESSGFVYQWIAILEQLLQSEPPCSFMRSSSVQTWQ
jgi:hypothetical protein